MRMLPAAALAAILAAAGAVRATAQSQPQVLTPGGLPQDNSVIVVPPAPTIVASPPSPPMPPAPVTPAAPGLVPASPPVAGDGGGNSDNGSSADSGSGGAPPASDQPGQTGPGSPAAGGTPDTALDQDSIPTPPNTWLPGKTAEIGVLDKVGGGVKEISVPVGGQLVVGDLQVNVLACVIRPPDQVPDAAVFLSLQSTDSPAAPPDYRGWLLRSAPGAAVAGDASEIFRIIDCS